MMPASRILVNVPDATGDIGLGTGLTPSLTLGCGAFGGNSTTENVTYQHLLNVKSLAYPISSASSYNNGSIFSRAFTHCTSRS